MKLFFSALTVISGLAIIVALFMGYSNHAIWAFIAFFLASSFLVKIIEDEER